MRREKEEFFRINMLRENPKTELRELNVDFGDRQNAAGLRGLRLRYRCAVNAMTEVG